MELGLRLSDCFPRANDLGLQTRIAATVKRFVVHVRMKS